jgi:hypothetical protein
MTHVSQRTKRNARVANGASMGFIPCWRHNRNGLALFRSGTCQVVGTNECSLFVLFRQGLSAMRTLPLKPERPSANWRAIPQAELTYRCQPKGW